MSNSLFKATNTFEKRKAESARILKKYPDRVPVICEKYEGSRMPDIDKRKYLVPSDITMGQFVYIIRRRTKLNPEDAIFLFVNNTLQPASSLMSDIYKSHKDSDGFLYSLYGNEASFG